MQTQPAYDPRLSPRRTTWLVGHCLLVGGLLVGCGEDERSAALHSPGDRVGEQPGLENVTFTSRVHIMPVPGAEPTRPPADAAVQYHGGKLVQTPKVVQVLYGQGTYIPEITRTTPPSLANAYTEMVSSSVFGWLSEYDTPAPVQRLGRGRFIKAVQIEPAAARAGALVPDASVQAELAVQIRSGVLPPPDDDALYMVHFPRGTTNLAPDGSLSCRAFCAYHGTFQIDSQNVYYAVLPDLGGAACADSCASASPFLEQTTIASRELISMITDPEVGLATVATAPLAWFDPAAGELATGRAFGEIGDLCAGQRTPFLGADSVFYTFHQGFSNRAHDCVATQLTDLDTSAADLLWRAADGTVSIEFISTGRTAGYAYPGRMPSTSRIVGAGYFDRDGQSDIVWHNDDGAVVIWFMDRGFHIRDAYPGARSTEWRVHGVGDFDHDGDSDLLWRAADGSVSVWYLEAGAITSQQAFGQPGLDWTIEGVGDFDVDGESDILWRDTDGVVAIWFLHKGAMPHQSYPGQRSLDWAIEGVGDFDADGDSDVLWRNVDGTVSIWLMNHEVLATESHVDKPGNDWVVQGIADLDHDGRSDIVWRNINSDDVGVWYMNGFAIKGQSYPDQPGHDWVMQGLRDFD